MGQSQIAHICFHDALSSPQVRNPHAHNILTLSAPSLSLSRRSVTNSPVHFHIRPGPPPAILPRHAPSFGLLSPPQRERIGRWHILGGLRSLHHCLLPPFRRLVLGPLVRLLAPSLWRETATATGKHALPHSLMLLLVRPSAGASRRLSVAIICCRRRPMRRRARGRARAAPA